MAIIYSATITMPNQILRRGHLLIRRPDHCASLPGSTACPTRVRRAIIRQSGLIWELEWTERELAHSSVPLGCCRRHGAQLSGSSTRPSGQPGISGSALLWLRGFVNLGMGDRLSAVWRMNDSHGFDMIG